MEQLFMEKIVKRKRTGADLAINIGIVVLAVVAGIAAILFIPSIGLFLAAGIGYGAWYLLGQRNVEFEYALTNGELDIDRIVARRRRKRIFSAHAKEFEMVAPQKSVYWSKEYRELKKVLDTTAGKEAEGVWFIVTPIGGTRGVVLFQPTPAMIDAMWHTNPRKVMRG